MIAGLLSALLLLARPEAVGAELLLAAGLVAVVLAVGVLLRTLRVPVAAQASGDLAGFAALRVRLRATDPAAAGHRRARAPGTTR